MRQAQSLLSRIESVPRRELYFFALYRTLEAGILAALMFSPLGEVLGEPRHPELGTAVTIGYLSLALVLFFIGRSVRWLTWIVFASVCIDVVAATLATHALPGATAGMAGLGAAPGRARRQRSRCRHRGHTVHEISQETPRRECGAIDLTVTGLRRNGAARVAWRLTLG